MTVSSIDEFVRQLYGEGVQAGQSAGNEIRERAREQADRMIEEARRAAEGIEERARREAEVIRRQMRAELELAARDILLELRRGIRDVLEDVVRKEAGAILSDGAYLKGLVRDLALRYADEDAKHVGVFEFAIPEQVADAIGDWALTQLREQLDGEAVLTLNRRLEGRGFALGLDEATLEVTPDSIVELLRAKLSATATDLLERAIHPQRDAQERG